MNAYELKDKLNSLMPFSISEKLINLGYYDNSGVICQGEGDKIVFTLDLTKGAIDFAIKNGCGLIVTHHPAIFTPIKSVTGLIADAIKKGIGVVSCHLNADFANRGVDYYLAKGLGAQNEQVLEKYDFGGYGRLFEFNGSLEDFVQKVKKVLGAKNLSVFGKTDKTTCKVATFCGAGLDEKTLELAKDADIILSADIKHHILLSALSQGKCVVMPTHFATENYGFNLISENFSKTIKEKVYYYQEDTLL